ncbi:hypothetical protein [Arthrobacter sp. UCD-GKA]|uniref:hypothetical protein n=1 Tax=Arthrobacter sp. UCD-GKA TaxID=1913576 RepID=UPI001587C78C|nr:hypothetical protein [Arthrobacter sp. UCD-GKA]
MAAIIRGYLENDAIAYTELIDSRVGSDHHGMWANADAGLVAFPEGPGSQGPRVP